MRRVPKSDVTVFVTHNGGLHFVAYRNTWTGFILGPAEVWIGPKRVRVRRGPLSVHRAISDCRANASADLLQQWSHHVATGDWASLHGWLTGRGRP